MKILNLTLTIILLGLYANLSASRIEIENIYQDSTIYDLNHFRDKFDRKPELYKCSQTDNFVFINSSLVRCIKSKVHSQVKNVNLISEFQFNNGSRCDPRIRYRSAFHCILNEKGKLDIIQHSNHCINSINEEEIISKLKILEWKPALKNLIPVKSRFVIEIIFKNTLQIDENWLNAKSSMYQFLKSNREELITIYNEKGVMWDTEILTPLLRIKNIDELNKALEIVEQDSKNQIIKNDKLFNSNTNRYEKSNSDELYISMNNWDKEFYSNYEKSLKFQLDKAANNN